MRFFVVGEEIGFQNFINLSHFELLETQFFTTLITNKLSKRHINVGMENIMPSDTGKCKCAEGAFFKN